MSLCDEFVDTVGSTVSIFVRAIDELAREQTPAGHEVLCMNLIRLAFRVQPGVKKERPHNDQSTLDEGIAKGKAEAIQWEEWRGHKHINMGPVSRVQESSVI